MFAVCSWRKNMESFIPEKRKMPKFVKKVRFQGTFGQKSEFLRWKLTFFLAKGAGQGEVLGELSSTICRHLQPKKMSCYNK